MRTLRESIFEKFQNEISLKMFLADKLKFSLSFRVRLRKKKIRNYYNNLDSQKPFTDKNIKESKLCIQCIWERVVLLSIRLRDLPYSSAILL